MQSCSQGAVGPSLQSHYQTKVLLCSPSSTSRRPSHAAVKCSRIGYGPARSTCSRCCTSAQRLNAELEYRARLIRSELNHNNTLYKCNAAATILFTSHVSSADRTSDNEIGTICRANASPAPSRHTSQDNTGASAPVCDELTGDDCAVLTVTIRKQGLQRQSCFPKHSSSSCFESRGRAGSVRLVLQLPVGNLSTAAASDAAQRTQHAGRPKQFEFIKLCCTIFIAGSRFIFLGNQQAPDALPRRRRRPRNQSAEETNREACGPDGGSGMRVRVNAADQKEHGEVAVGQRKPKPTLYIQL